MHNVVESIDHQQKSNTAFASEEVAQSSWYRTYDLRYEEDVVSRYFLPGRRVLDLGCGYGRTTVSLKRRGYDVVGVDIVDRMIESARLAHPDIDYRVMDACALDFPDESFDYVLFSFNGLDCILPESRRLKAMMEIRRVLKPGGTFVFSSHNWLPYLILPNHWRSGRFLSFLRSGVLTRRWYGAGVENIPFDCYISTPFRTLQQLRSLNFEVVHVAPGQRGFRRPLKALVFPVLCMDLWPHFIARKPDVGGR
jgi:SAM-dependent methyltransferase